MSTPLPVNFSDLPIGLNPTNLFDQQFAAATDGQYMQDKTLPTTALVPATAGFALFGNGPGVAPSFQVASVAVGNISGLGIGVATWLGTPSSANLAAALTDETGTGSAVFATNPVLVAPNLGTPSAINLANGINLPLNGGVSGTLDFSQQLTGDTTNLCEDPYFASSRAWAVTGLASLVTGAAIGFQSTSTALQTSATTSFNTFAQMTKTLKVQPGDVFSISASLANISLGAGSSIRLVVLFLNAAGTLLTTPAISWTSADPSTYTTRTLVATAPAGAVSMNLLVQNNGTTTTGAALFGFVGIYRNILQQIAAALPTMLPGTPGVVWNNGGVLSIS